MHITDDILIKFLLTETTAEENIAVEEWLGADEANRKHYVQIKTIWDSSRELATKSTVSENEAWTRFSARVQSISPSKTEILNGDEAIVKRLDRGFPWMRIAAILVLLIGAVFLRNYLSQNQYTSISADRTVVVQTLPDGSEITLNRYSNLSYASDFKEDRRIKLEKGEAFFKVAPDKSHPFVIKADDVEVRVVGTEFNVKHLNDTTEVIVETGIVKVTRAQQVVELRRGEKVLIVAGTKSLLKQQNNDQLYNFYQSKMLVAVNTPLTRIAEVLNKNYPVKLAFKTPEVAQLTITTTFKDQSYDQIIDVICQTLNLKAERSQNQILLSDNK